MRAINHALTGALIGLTVGEPVVAVPAAFLSHFICDALPHYDFSGKKGESIRQSEFRVLLYVDIVACVLLVMMLGLRKPQHWLLAAICAFLAASPDFLWLPRYLKRGEADLWRPPQLLRFASTIQWFQRPIGWTVEAAWFVGCMVLLVPFLR